MKGKRKREIGKEMKKMEKKRERKEKKGGRCAPAATAAAVGHAGAGHGRWGTRSRGGEEKGEREKEGAGFAAAGRDASRWMGKDGTRIEIGCRVVQEKNFGNRVQGLRGVELNEKQL